MRVDSVGYGFKSMLFRECLRCLFVKVMQAERIVITDRNLPSKSFGGDFGTRGISRTEVVSFECGFHSVSVLVCGVF